MLVLAAALPVKGGREEDGGRAAGDHAQIYQAGIHCCQCSPGRGAMLVPSAVISVTCHHGLLPGKSSGTKNIQGRADGVSSLPVLGELARRLTPSGTAAACRHLLLHPAGQGLLSSTGLGGHSSLALLHSFTATLARLSEAVFLSRSEARH